MKIKYSTAICLAVLGLVYQGAAATFTVTTTESEGPGSLRDAILNVNTGSVDRIEFRIPPLDGTAKTIVLSNALPSIANSVAIDGYTQGTASRNTLTGGNDARVLIELTASPATGPAFSGLTFSAGSNTVEGLSIHGFDNAIVLGGLNGNSRILGNFVGLRPSGLVASSLSNQHGVVIRSPDNRVGGPSTGERNIISGNLGSGILISDPGATNNVIHGNFIGTDRHGIASVPNGDGISLGTRHTGIGSADPGTGNVISGNARDGIFIGLGADYTLVQNNLIGTDVSGTLPLPNGSAGVSLASSFNQIGNAEIELAALGPGGPGLPRGNVISGNLNVGLRITGPSAVRNRVVANLIGTDITGTRGLGNRGNGILIFEGDDTFIGGFSFPGGPSLGNVISANFGSGIFVNGGAEFTYGLTIADNRIGTDINGVHDLGNMAHGIVFSRVRNSIIGGNVIAHNDLVGLSMGAPGTNNVIGTDRFANFIFDNGWLGIDLAGTFNPFDGVTANDNCDLDANLANFGQNFPVITFATNTAEGARIDGFINSTPNTRFIIDFFRNDHCDPSGHGQGAIWIASTNITTGVNCRGNFTVTSPVSLAGCQFITAIATDPNNNSSEFSQCFAVGESGGCAAAPAGLSNWWPGDGVTANLAVGGASLELSNGAAFAPGKAGDGFSFDGTDDFASVADSPSLRSPSFTLEAWVNFRTVSGTGRRSLMGKPVGSALNNSYAMFLQNGTLGGAIANASSVSILLTTFAPATGVWYHVAYTYNRADSNHAFYVNGVLQRRATANITNNYDASALMIGADRNAGNLQEFFAGLIDEPAIYDRALSSVELQDIFCGGNLGKCRQPSRPCSIVCPADIVTNTAAGQCGATVNYSPPSVTGDCPPVVCTPLPGAFFLLGTNTVVCTTNGVIACSFRIIVQDREPPTITCPANVSVEAPAGQTNSVVNYPSPTASDNCASVTVNSVPPSGSTFPMGTNTVTCTATDATGNTTSCQFLIVVNPPATGLRFSGIRVEGNDIRLLWLAQGGTTNRVQTAGTLTNTFTNLGPSIIIPGTGLISTNYLETGGATSGPSRFYRVRLLP